MTTVRRALRTVGTVVVVAFAGAAVWLLAQARYLEDYCLTRAPLPGGATEGVVVRGPSYDRPWRLRCDWPSGPDVVVTDVLPLAGAVLVVGVVLVAAVAVWRAGRPAGEQPDGE